MSKPTEHKTVQARILGYAGAILLRFGYEGQVGWWFVSRREMNHRERRDRKEVSDSVSLSSLCSLRFSISEFRGFDRRDRRDRKEDLDSEPLSSLCSLRLYFSELLDTEVRVFNPCCAVTEGALRGNSNLKSSAGNERAGDGAGNLIGRGRCT